MHCDGCTGGEPGRGQMSGDWLPSQTSALAIVTLYEARKSYAFGPLFEKS